MADLLLIVSTDAALPPLEQSYVELLKDVLGVVSVISHVSSLRTRGRQAEVMKRTVTISNARDTGPTVDVVLWGERATAFPAEQVHRDSGSSPQIIIFVGTLVRSYAGQGSGVPQNKGTTFIHEPSLTPESRKVSSSAKTSPHQGDNLLLGTEIIPAPPNVQTPSGAHNTPGANTLRLADAYSVLDGSTNKTHKSVTRKRSRTSPSKKAAKKRFRDEGITDDDVAGSTDVDAE
ncbi:putative replication protein [Zea mays]|uniref:Putative replication protein n=1 Tax=Zea mays TaxID=4577 RepID=A0A1D6GUC3_MAIZE|nr:putative replication protein [Zea mays]